MRRVFGSPRELAGGASRATALRRGVALALAKVEPRSLGLAGALAATTVAGALLGVAPGVLAVGLLALLIVD